MQYVGVPSAVKVIACAIGVVVGAACTAGGAGSESKPSTSPRATPTATPAKGLSVQVFVPRRTMRTGSSTTATVIVRNDTGSIQRAEQCDTPFQVALDNLGGQPQLVWRDCPEGFAIPEGKTTYPVTLSATTLDSNRRPAPLPPGGTRSSCFSEAGSFTCQIRTR